jgi:hypothetical protein
MSRSIALAAAAALVGSLAVGPGFAQTTTTCGEFSSMTDEGQMETLNALLMEVRGAEGTPETNAEILSMLRDKCTEFPDTPAVQQLNDLPIEVQN